MLETGQAGCENHLEMDIMRYQDQWERGEGDIMWKEEWQITNFLVREIEWLVVLLTNLGKMG